MNGSLSNPTLSTTCLLLQNAMHHLCHELLGWSAQAQEISGLWTEYEAATSPEALLVKDFDKFEMIMQALEYEQCK